MTIQSLVFWYFYIVGVLAHIWVVWQLIKQDFRRPSRYAVNAVPNTPVNPWQAKRIQCAECGALQYVEAGSDAYLCTDCLNNPAAFGGH
jgi:hypothetical protein